ncbi:MAG: PIN domain-containing protein [bacterium]|nr:PIN domain-containing protein [bacterium]
MKTSSEVDNYLLLDSCIVQYLLNKEISPNLRQQLKKWSGDIFNFAISEITYAELLNGTLKNKEAEVISLLDKFYSFTISKRIIKGCGKLGSVYKEYNQSLKEIDTGDRIIASTAIINNLFIVTANVRDFPFPFFSSIANYNIIFEKKRNKRMISIAVLKPNYEFITHAFNHRL